MVLCKHIFIMRQNMLYSVGQLSLFFFTSQVLFHTCLTHFLYLAGEALNFYLFRFLAWILAFAKENLEQGYFATLPRFYTLRFFLCGSWKTIVYPWKMGLPRDRRDSSHLLQELIS